MTRWKNLLVDAVVWMDAGIFIRTQHHSSRGGGGCCCSAPAPAPPPRPSFLHLETCRRGTLVLQKEQDEEAFQQIMMNPHNALFTRHDCDCDVVRLLDPHWHYQTPFRQQFYFFFLRFVLGSYCTEFWAQKYLLA